MKFKPHILKVFLSVFSNIGATLILSTSIIGKIEVLIFNIIFIIISLSLALKLEELIYKYDLSR